MIAYSVVITAEVISGEKWRLPSGYRVIGYRSHIICAVSCINNWLISTYTESYHAYCHVYDDEILIQYSQWATGRAARQ